MLTFLENEGIRPRWVHLAATEGAFRTKDKRINAVRLGIGLYQGGLRLISTITKVRRAKKGEKVGYDGTGELKKDSFLGVVPVGYYEALDRRLSNKGVVKYRDEYYLIAGRVCMNMCVVDFGDTEVKAGEKVEGVGVEGGNSFEEMAKTCETIEYELMVRINPTIRRKVV